MEPGDDALVEAACMARSRNCISTALLCCLGTIECSICTGERCVSTLQWGWFFISYCDLSMVLCKSPSPAASMIYFSTHLLGQRLFKSSLTVTGMHVIDLPPTSPKRFRLESAYHEPTFAIANFVYTGSAF